MVIGLDIFKKYFGAFPDNYVVIGGTACDIFIDEAGLEPRATKDIDIILVVEALNPEFVEQFWQFIKDGDYEHREESADERKYYRFKKPRNPAFPYQIELFSRTPDIIAPTEDTHLTPIPVDGDLSSLSAILLHDDFYNYMIAHSTFVDGTHIANIEALICLKAKAYLDISARIANGSREDKKHLRKHKGDVFRLAVMLSEDSRFELPESIRGELQSFVNVIVNDLPDKAIFREMGLGTVDVKQVFNQLLTSFDLKENG